MSGVFVRASNTRIRINSTTPAGLPTSGYPLTVGMWLNMSSVSATFNTLFSLANSSSNTHSLRIQIDYAEKLAINAVAGGISANGTLATALVAGEWCYCIARYINSTNRRISAMYKSGLIEHAQSTTSRVPTNLDRLALGISDDATPDVPCDAMIAEFFYTNTDIQADGAQLSEATLRQLAFRGPFSLPHIASGIMHYRSLRTHPICGDGTDIYFGRSAQDWVNSGVTVGPHPPLSADYVAPPWARTRRSNLVMT